MLPPFCVILRRPVGWPRWVDARTIRVEDSPLRCTSFWFVRVGINNKPRKSPFWCPGEATKPRWSPCEPHGAWTSCGRSSQYPPTPKSFNTRPLLYTASIFLVNLVLILLRETLQFSLADLNIASVYLEGIGLQSLPLCCGLASLLMFLKPRLRDAVWEENHSLVELSASGAATRPGACKKKDYCFALRDLRRAPSVAHLTQDDIFFC